MEQNEIEEQLNSIKDEYRKLANFDLVMVFLLCLTLWASLVGQYWLAYGLLFLNVACIFLRFNYMRTLFK